MKLKFSILISSLTLFACQPSLQSKSAGQIGCVPAEITVSNASSDTGWSQSTESWIAACNGKEYVCTEVITSGGKGGANSQVSCKERG